MGLWAALFLGLLIGVVIAFGREVVGWYPEPDSYVQNTLYAGIFWFTGTLAYAIAKRPVAACAAWIVEPLWTYSGTDWLRIVIPVAIGVVLGWLMAIGGNRVTYARLLIATLLTMAIQQAAFMYFRGYPFLWVEVAGAVIGATAAYVVGWAFRR